jgi:hypothetical protein
MASPVPYSPDPQIAPQDRPIPYREVNAPVAAFGGATAAALESQGQVVEGVGKELFSRALAIQQLNQQADASEKVAAYTTKLGDEYNKFSSLSGKAASDAYQPFADKINSIREDIRGTLTSPFAQRAFDQESRSMQARAQWTAGRYAGDQNKSYLKGAAQAEQDGYSNYALANPTDDASFQVGKQKTIDLANHKADLDNLSADDPMRKQMVQQATSTLTASRIQGLAKDQPFTAAKMLDAASKAGDISGQDLGRLTEYVNRQKLNVGTRQGASDFMAGKGTSFGEGKVSIDQAMEGIHGAETPGYKGDAAYSARGPVVKEGPYAGQQAIGKYQVMPGNLPSWLKEAGMPAMSEDEFAGSKDAQEQLFKTRFGGLMEKYGSFNKAANVWFTGKPDPDPNKGDGYNTPPQYLQKANAALAHASSGAALSTAARGEAERLAPGDALFADNFQQHVELLRAREESIRRQDEYNNQNTIFGAMAADDQGKLPTSVEDITGKSPEAKIAWDALPEKDQATHRRELIANASRGGYAATPQNEAEYTRLLGMALSSDRSPEETKELLDLNASMLPMPRAWRDDIMKRQASIMKGLEVDPQMGKALKAAAGMLGEAGISPKNKDDYNQFVGAYHNVIQGWVDENKKQPKDDDLKEIAGNLIKDRSQHWWNSADRLYATEMKPEDTAKVTAVYRKAHGTDPSPTEIHDIWVASQYQYFFGKKKAQ